MTGGKELRKALEEQVRTALADRGFLRQRKKTYFESSDVAGPPLVARLIVEVDTDRYGTVRMGGSAEVVSAAVDEAFASAPDESLNRFQRMYRDRRSFALAKEPFDALDERPRREPLEWFADDEESGERAFQEMLAFVDGPVRTWLDSRSSVALVRAAVAPGGADESRGALVRTVSVLDALLGERESGIERLRRYGAHPEGKFDSPEQVEAFLRWLETVEPRPDVLVAR